MPESGPYSPPGSDLVQRVSLCSVRTASPTEWTTSGSDHYVKLQQKNRGQGSLDTLAAHTEEGIDYIAFGATDNARVAEGVGKV